MNVLTKYNNFSMATVNVREIFTCTENVAIMPINTEDNSTIYKKKLMYILLFLKLQEVNILYL